jgi:hypothetical protein
MGAGQNRAWAKSLRTSSRNWFGELRHVCKDGREVVVDMRFASGDVCMWVNRKWAPRGQIDANIATGWTECLPLVTRDGSLVVEAMQHAQSLFPWLLRGVDFRQRQRVNERRRRALVPPAEA